MILLIMPILQVGKCFDYDSKSIVQPGIEL